MKSYRPRELALIRRLTTPEQVQAYLRRMAYNRERHGETARGFRGVVQHRMAHCLEAALFSATVLEHHGYPPTVMSLESHDGLDHVLHVFRRDRDRGPWGAIARSRDEGLHGRAPVFASLRALAVSYQDPYVDATGRITGYALYDLRALGAYDWRLREGNLRKVEQVLIEYPHHRLHMSDARFDRLHARYAAFRAKHPKAPPDYHVRTHRWW